MTLAASAAVVATGTLGLAVTGASASTSGSPPVGVASGSVGSGTTGSGTTGSNSCSPSSSDVQAVLRGTRGNWAAICGGPFLLKIPSDTWPFTTLTIYVTNRVWLHQTYPAKGWSDCYEVGNPAKTFSLSGRDQRPGDMQVSSTTSACPRK